MDVFHRDEEGPVDLPDVEDRASDVRVREGGRDACLVEQHGDEGLVLAQLRQDPLDHHELLEACYRAMECEVQLGHAADGELSQQRVLAELARQDLLRIARLHRRRRIGISRW